MTIATDGRIQVKYVERPGFEGVAGSFRSPVIDVGMGFDPSCFKSGKTNASSNIFPIRALLDTGADEFHVDTSLLDKWGAPELSNEAMIRTIHGTSILLKRQVHLFVREAFFCAEVDVVSSKLRDGTRAYDAIFGMRFLERGQLVLNVSGESYFEFHKG